MKKYLVSVCKGPDCRRNGSDAVFAEMKSAVQQAGLSSRCEVYRGGCYGLCHLGANVVIREDTGRKKDPLSREDFQLMGWPGETHYGTMTPEKARRVVKEHLAEDREIPELFPPPGAPKPGPA